ncbi:MAG: MotA/TolQ/ExbB proton channel family protein [Candidatus Omnitrophica bacterium]|nr:MotA/TolQ/ExbB proton channel family protein [Candidatus Omnitrophota bacterium]
MSITQLLAAGGFTLYILGICSIISLAIIIERFIIYRMRSRVNRVDFMAKLSKEIETGNIKNALLLCKAANTPFADVAASGLNMHGHSEEIISNTMERAVTIEMINLEKFTGVVGTIGSTAVYIGLFGTVLGIIRAFKDISLTGSGGINVVINGISEALVCTAAGLCVAVPAVIAYNYFVRKVDIFITDMELCASETTDLLNRKK